MFKEWKTYIYFLLDVSLKKHIKTRKVCTPEFR